MGKPKQRLREERNEENEVERKKILEINKKMAKLTSDPPLSVAKLAGKRKKRWRAMVNFGGEERKREKNGEGSEGR